MACVCSRYNTRSDWLIVGNYFHVMFTGQLPCIQMVRRKFELTNQESAGRKNLLSWRYCKITRIALKLFSPVMAVNIHEKGFTITKTISDWKKVKNMKHYVSKVPIWRQKWVASVRHGNSLVVRRVSPGRVIGVVLNKSCCSPSNYRLILKLTIRSIFSIALIFVSFEKKAIIVSFR